MTSAQLIETALTRARSDLMSLPFILCFIASRSGNWIRGRWVERPGPQRRRRYYRLTASGKNVLVKTTRRLA